MTTYMPYGWQKTGETYTCERCGKPTSNRRLFVDGPIGGKDGYSWCGYEDSDSWEFEGEYDDEYECPSCGELFILERVVDITYTSKRRIEDMPKGWRGDD